MNNKRRVIARVGIVLLNFFAPGSGLLRLGRWKFALPMFSVWIAFLLFWRFGPPAPFAVILAAVITLIASLGAGLWLSWKLSRDIQTDPPWYARWYIVVTAAIAAIALNVSLTDRDHRHYRNFYMPSESMAPSLQKGDRFVAYMVSPATVRRGDLVLVRTASGAIYVKRVAAIGGDRFAMKNGVIVLNGVAVPQGLLRSEMVTASFGTERAKRLTEQFPGEATAHEIYDAEPTSTDDIAELEIPAGAAFLLGDNRDRSADSRVPAEYGGLSGAVPVSGIVGVPFYVSWGSSRPMGTKLQR